MEIVTPTFRATQEKYEGLLDQYDGLVEQLENVVNDVNYGPDLSDEGREVLDNLRNAVTILTAAGRFLPDTLKQ